MARVRTTATAIAILLAHLLGGCAGSSLGDAVQRSLEADSQLAETPPFGITPASTPNIDTVESEDQGDANPTATTASSTSDNDDSEGQSLAPQPGDANFIGPVLPAGPLSPSLETVTGKGPNLDVIPEDLRSYVADLIALDPDLLKGDATWGEDGVDFFTQPISRREYARWLFALNNQFHQDAAAKRIRGGNRSDKPAFQDVPPEDPDFAAIQGLAAAGIIPSALTGNSTAVTFRPDAPLTRETLVLWKVPLDTRATLPTTTPEAVTQTWAFQDVNTIEPLALRAIAADFQLGDFANIRRAFGYTTLLQPQKAVTRSEAAAALWRFGTQTDGITAQEIADTR
ncbi:S-layer homology domain-containing protein [Leptolyngbya sp. PCC 6406]|uniref:S-layer homology domain-containing protein n=1 Tax=Leptolyngbya sp. PCC 6406 TaxID=1173264 RepID=UPI0002AC9CD3|nr:S-layer homology domain-containing protein [Leptolyngbya sp. PCC 6406]